MITGKKRKPTPPSKSESPCKKRKTLVEMYFLVEKHVSNEESFKRIIDLHYFERNYDEVKIETITENVILTFQVTRSLVWFTDYFDMHSEYEIDFQRPETVPTDKKIHLGICEDQLEIRAFEKCSIENNDNLCKITKSLQSRSETGALWVDVDCPKLYILCNVIKIIFS